MTNPDPNSNLRVGLFAIRLGHIAPKLEKPGALLGLKTEC
jgi:hypothetical protein